MISRGVSIETEFQFIQVDYHLSKLAKRLIFTSSAVISRRSLVVCKNGGAAEMLFDVVARGPDFRAAALIFSMLPE
jgi:hypothetical protein